MGWEGEVVGDEIGRVRGWNDVAEGVRGIAWGEGCVARFGGALGWSVVDGWVRAVEGMGEGGKGLRAVAGVIGGIWEGLRAVERVREVAGGRRRRENRGRTLVT